MNKILNFGSLNIDMVYALPHIVRPGETVASTKMDIYPGGKGLNQSIALARAGGDVYHAGKIGSDGSTLKNTLMLNRVNCTLLTETEEKNGHAVIQVDKKGQNSILLYGGTNKSIGEKMIDDVLSHFGSGDIMVCQNEISNMDYLLRRAAERRLPIVLNPSPIDDDILKCDLTKIDTLIVNEIEGGEFTGETDSDKICDALLKRAPELKIVLTVGKGGVIYRDKANRFTHGIFNVPVADTTAAGDTFLGFFTALVHAKTSVQSALRYASAASSIAVSRAGASVSIPTLDEVEKFLSEHPKDAL